MTERLYYDDAYLTEFDGTVLECVEKDGAHRVRLDRSAFYPTSGGQPYDTGTLNGARVTDVCVDEAGEVWHAVDGRCPSARRCTAASTGRAASTTCSSTPGTT